MANQQENSTQHVKPAKIGGQDDQEGLASIPNTRNGQIGGLNNEPGKGGPGGLAGQAGNNSNLNR